MKTCTTFLLLFVCLIGKAQTLSKKYVDDWVIKSDTSYKVNLINAYVFKGKAFQLTDSVKFNQVLSAYKQTDLLTIFSFWNRELKGAYADGPYGLLVLITEKHNQKRKYKRYHYKLALAKFARTSKTGIDSSAYDPALVIDNKVIPADSCYQVFKKIRPGSVSAIYYTKFPAPQAYFGPNAKNGLVTVSAK